MKNDLQNQRSRIEKILKKFSYNYTSPISLAGQNMNKLTRHRKQFTFDLDSTKESDQNIKSLQELYPDINTTRQIKLEKELEKEKLFFDSKNVFKFQTLREALALNQKITQLKKNEKNIERRVLVTKTKHKKNNSEGAKVTKIINFLPSLQANFKIKTQKFLKNLSPANPKKVFEHSVF